MPQFSAPLKRAAKFTLRALGTDLVGKAKSDNARLVELASRHPVDVTELIVAMMVMEKREPFFVQIGANDGDRDDRFGPLIVKYDLAGLLVEPQPDPFARLIRRYSGRPKLIFENVAIAPASGTLTLYRFDHACERHLRLDVYTSSDRAKLEQAKIRHRLQAGIEPLVVPATTIDDLLRQHQITQVSLIVIDTEGFDCEVIKLIDLQRLRPALIQFEHRLLSTQVREDCYHRLIAAGYGLCPGRYDTFAVLPVDSWPAGP